MTVEHVLCNFLAKFSSEKKISVLLNFMRRPFFFTKLLISIEMIESNLQNARVIIIF